MIVSVFMEKVFVEKNLFKVMFWFKYTEAYAVQANSKPENKAKCKINQSF